ncbi:MAG: toprim domain-containing protein [Thaumarchaeota archaeon]|nr:toprim domain-containing protein [Nitrososphaerota archaeon]
MLITEQEVFQVRDFISQLNSMKDSVVIVEGKKDVNALRLLGFSGNLLQIHRFRGFIQFADHVAQYKNVIILFDRDRKGRQLTRKAVRLLTRRTRVDLSFKKRLCVITRGQVVFTEQLRYYAPYLS